MYGGLAGQKRKGGAVEPLALERDGAGDELHDADDDEPQNEKDEHADDGEPRIVHELLPEGADAACGLFPKRHDRVSFLRSCAGRGARAFSLWYRAGEMSTPCQYVFLR